MVRAGSTLFLLATVASATPGSATPSNELTVGRWLTPAMAGGAGVDFGFSRPTWELGYSRWQGDWGAALSGTVFGETSVPFSTTPFFPGGAVLADLQGQYRWQLERFTLQGSAGYRYFSPHRVGLATVAGAATAPVNEFVALQAEMLAGANVFGAYTFDQRLALALRWGPAGLALGYRRLVLQCGCDPLEPAAVLGGPTAELSFTF